MLLPAAAAHLTALADFPSHCIRAAQGRCACSSAAVVHTRLTNGSWSWWHLILTHLPASLSPYLRSRAEHNCCLGTVTSLPLLSWIQETSWVRALDNSNVSYGSANFSSCFTHSSQIPAMPLQVPTATATPHLNCQNTQLPDESIGALTQTVLQRDILPIKTRGRKQGQLYLPYCSAHILVGTKVHRHSSCVSESTPAHTRQTLCTG